MHQSLMFRIHSKYVRSQFSRHEADAPVFDGADRGLGERRDPDVPLVGQPGLDHRAAAIAARNRQPVRLDLVQEAGGLEVGDDALARLEAVEAAIGGGRLVVDLRVGRQDVDQRQSQPLADLVVVEVMCGRQLDAARAEGGVDEFVGNQRNLRGR